MNKFKVNISGMTCTGCEKHVESALEKIGAKNIESSYRRGEAVFELPDDIEVESAIKAIADANYHPGEAEEFQSDSVTFVKIAPSLEALRGNHFSFSAFFL